MATQSAISVVMPVYNGEAFVAQAIDSILAQSFENFEFIIVDDGSVDRTPEILAEYTRRDGRVRVHRQPNRGVTQALNQGIQIARAPLIARMDADDVSLPTRFAKQIQYLNANPDVAVLGSSFYPIDAKGEQGDLHTYPTEPGLVAWSMLFYNSLAHPTVMMRRSVLDPVAAYNVEYRNIEQDYDLFSRLSLVTRLANLAEPLLLYRVWGGNVSHNADRANHVLRDFVVRHGIEIDLDDATALLGLARDRFPSEPERIRRMASIIRRMRSQYVKRFASDPRDVRAIDQDAAMRLWLLAALSVGRSPWLGLSLASAATRIRPSSIAPFASKVATRLQQRARM